MISMQRTRFLARSSSLHQVSTSLRTISSARSSARLAFSQAQIPTSPIFRSNASSSVTGSTMRRSFSSASPDVDVEGRIGTSLPALRTDLAKCYRVADHMGFSEGVCNHFTVALPGDRSDEFLVIPHGTHWSKVMADDLIVVRTDGTIVESSSPSDRVELTAAVLHGEIHKRLGERARCVLHTHQPYVTTLCALKGDLGSILPVHQNSCRFIGVTSYDRDFSGLGNDPEEGARVASCFSDNSRVLLSANHGIFVIGRTIAEAFDDLYYIERAAMIQVKALQAAGGDVSKLQLIDPEVVKITHEQQNKASRIAYSVAHFYGVDDCLPSH